MSTLKIYFQLLASIIRWKREIRQIHIENKSFKLYLFTDNNVSYVDYPKRVTYIHTQIMRIKGDFSSILGYEINILKIHFISIEI